MGTRRPKRHAAAQQAAIPTDSIQILLNKKQRGEAGPVLQLGGLHRFAIDATYTDVTGQELWMRTSSSVSGGSAQRYNSGYDCVLADGRAKLRCVMSTDLNGPIEDGSICQGAIVHVDEWIYPRYNDIVLGGGEPLLIIKKLTISYAVFRRYDAVQLSELPWEVESHKVQKPLVGHRNYYLSLYDDSAPYGSQWTVPERASDDSVVDDSDSSWEWETTGWMGIDDVDAAGEIYSVRDALDLTGDYHHESRPLAQTRTREENAAAAKARVKRRAKKGKHQAFAPMYGVVIKKANLIHYAKIDDHGKCPFVFHIIVQDQERTNVKLTFWTTSAKYYFSRLSVGDPVAICRYRLNNVLNSANADECVAEVAVNPANSKVMSRFDQSAAGDATASPDACPFAVRKLTGEAAEALELDTLPSPFITLSSRHVCQLTDGATFDFVGAVSFIGDRHITVNRQAGPDNLRLKCWCWLKMRDQCSPRELAIRVDVNSQAGVFGQIRVGGVLLLTNIKVEKKSVSGEDQSMSFRSTFHTQLYSEHSLPNLPQARKVQKWAQSVRAKSTAPECSSLLLPFYTFDSFRRTFQVSRCRRPAASSRPCISENC